MRTSVEIPFVRQDHQSAGFVFRLTPDAERLAVRTHMGAVTLIPLSEKGVELSIAAAKAPEPFAQVSEGFDAGEDGTGLGLPLVRAMARLHGGDMSIDSKPEAGTTVHVTIPPARVVRRLRAAT